MEFLAGGGGLRGSTKIHVSFSSKKNPLSLIRINFVPHSKSFQSIINTYTIMGKKTRLGSICKHCLEIG